MRFTRTAATALAAVALTVGVAHPAAARHQLRCPGHVVTVDIGERPTWHGRPCTVAPPQRLDIRAPGFDGGDDEYARRWCADLGGRFTLVWRRGTATVVCRGVDY